MAIPRLQRLSRRERQFMDIIYRLGGRATAAQVMENLPDPPSYSAVRASLRVLEEKGILRHEYDGPRYVFVPTVSRSVARQSALKLVVKNYFDNSTENAVAALLDMAAYKMSEEELDRLSQMIDEARKEGR
jgi:predicted transcriptional regulator